jgi:DNA-directed RNA polymerase specialized sigma24 family protein
MIWRDRRSLGGTIDAEGEQELRLIAQARSGAAWAVAALVARYQPPIVRYLVRLTGHPELALELAESIFVRMGKRVRGPHGGEHLRLWLLRAATDVGLDTLRHPNRPQRPRLAAPAEPAGLLGSQAGETTDQRGTKRRDAHAPRSAPRTQQFVWQRPDDTRAVPGNVHDSDSADAVNPMQLSPREALRRRLVRAVLAELPYGDAQCLALHLVAGLNQSEVADALGLAAPMARRRIVQGLQLFGRRYEAALASLGLPEETSASTSGHDDAPTNVGGAANAALAGEPPTLADGQVNVLGEAEEREPALAGAASDDTPGAPVFAGTAVEDATIWDAIWSAAPAPTTQEPGEGMAIVVDADPAPGLAVSSTTGTAPDRDAGEAAAPAAVTDNAPPAPGVSDTPEDADAPRHAWDAASVFASLAALSASALADTDYTHLYQSDLDESDAAARAQMAEGYEGASAGQGDVDDSAAVSEGELPVVAWEFNQDVEESALADTGVSDEDVPSGQEQAAASEHDVSGADADGLADADHAHFLVVMEAEPHAGAPHDSRPSAAVAWEARRARVLSADGEAEDPTDAQPDWPAQ